MPLHSKDAQVCVSRGLGGGEESERERERESYTSVLGGPHPVKLVFFANRIPTPPVGQA